MERSVILLDQDVHVCGTWWMMNIMLLYLI
jgi:hypothetical protein